MTSTPDMLTVQVRADEDSRLADLVAERRRTGEARFDEWWNGVYRIVTGPSITHGAMMARLCVLFLPLADERRLVVSAPTNIGVDGQNARVPDIAVLPPDVEMTSSAFAATADLVVEILSPREITGEKLDFYADQGVREYLEVDLAHRTCRLLSNSGGRWRPIDESTVLGFHLDRIDDVLVDLDSGD